MMADMDPVSLSQDSDTQKRQAAAAPKSVQFYITRRAFLRVAGVLGLVFGAGLHNACGDTKLRRSLVRPEIAPRKIPPALVVGLEIGTSKICIAVGERWRDGRINLLSVSQAPAVGVRNGEIVDLKAVVKCLRDALVDAETKSDVLIRSISVGVTGAHIQSFNNSGVVFLREARDSVSAEDIEATRIKARDVNIPMRNDFLHFRAQRYQVDDQLCVLDPIGLPGQKLKADFHIIYGERTRLLKTIRCVKELPLELEDVVFAPLASAEVLLTQNQKNRGALVIDLGAGTTGYVLYVDGAATQSGMLPSGGDQITNDLSIGLRMPWERAETLKIESGSAMAGSSLVDAEDPRALHEWGGRFSDAEIMHVIIYLRLRATLEKVKARLVEKGARFDQLGGGIYLTGGSSLQRGVVELTSEVFGVPAFGGTAKGFDGDESVVQNPQYSCAIGLLKLSGWKSESDVCLNTGRRYLV